ncbi:glycoside hydrolase family 2 protein [Bacteroides sedimenti]
MKTKNSRVLIMCIVQIICISTSSFQAYAQKDARRKICFNNDWYFYRMDDANATDINGTSTGLYDKNRTDFASQFLNEYIQSGGSAASDVMKNEVEKGIADFHREYPGLKDKIWNKVVLPHTAKIEPITSQNPCWEGVSYYRKSFSIEKSLKGKKLFLEFEGAMQQSDVWLNGQLVLQHKGGYTPFSIDLTKLVNYDKPNEIIVRLDNRADRNFPVGKDLKRNGFTYWSGIYRSVFLHVTNPVHITDAVKVNKVAGGGVFFRTPEVDKNSATALVKTNVVNEGNINIRVRVRQILLNSSGKQVKESLSETLELSKGGDVHIEQQFKIENPSLWHPDHPFLYTLKTTVFADNKQVDEMVQKVGFRKLSFSKADGFRINDEPLYLVGTNRHQDYPYIGVALSKNAQYRDMKKIKEAGYNSVRLAHYTHDPAVYEAADELGLMLLDGIPGWQFFNNNDIFKQRVFRDIRDMIHRDRNHPSVVLWEPNLNESYPPDEFRNQCHLLAHEELPVGEYFTTGETYGAKKTIWDVAMNNWSDSQDSIFRNTTERAQTVQPNSPGIIKEYSDWEFGGWSSTTRSSRETGEKAMLQGLWNTIWSHNANIANYAPATVGDFTWAMYDNYISNDKKLFEWGTADYFRLPKFTGYFFRSQLEPYKKIAGIETNQPVVFIANWWTGGGKNEQVVVLSNCDKVVLKVNNRIVAEQLPDNGPDTFYGVPDKGGKPFDGGNCSHLKHPAFTFNNIAFEKGELKAEGYINGSKVSEQIVRTPEKPVRIKLEADLSGKPLSADGADAVFVHASIIDQYGTVSCLDNTTKVEFSVNGDANIVGSSIVQTRGGIASILLQSTSLKSGKITIFAKVRGLKEGTLILISK